MPLPLRVALGAAAPWLLQTITPPLVGHLQPLGGPDGWLWVGGAAGLITFGVFGGRDSVGAGDQRLEAGAGAEQEGLLL